MNKKNEESKNKEEHKFVSTCLQGFYRCFELQGLRVRNKGFVQVITCICCCCFLFCFFFVKAVNATATITSLDINDNSGIDLVRTVALFFFFLYPSSLLSDYQKLTHIHSHTHTRSLTHTSDTAKKL